MSSLKEFLKFSVVPKKLYLHFSAHHKLKRSEKKGEVELRLLPYLVDPQRLAIDVGANKGLYTYFLAKHAKEVIAFEPHENLSRFLQKATASNVTVINKCLSDKEETVDFHVPIVNGKVSYNSSSLEADMLAGYETNTIQLESAPLDQFNIENVGYIKIDVEGHEMNVLKGAKKTIQTSRPILQIEILTENGDVSNHEVVQFLQDLDYEMLCLQNNILGFYVPDSSSKASRNFIFLPKT